MGSQEGHVIVTRMHSLTLRRVLDWSGSALLLAEAFVCIAIAVVHIECAIPVSKIYPTRLYAKSSLTE